VDTDEDWSWREKGKCWGRHAPGASGARDPWFPAENTTSVVSTPHQLEREEAAARLCAGCPVIEQCLTYGVELGEVAEREWS
jgi:Transcription factor WhiB